MLLVTVGSGRISFVRNTVMYRKNRGPYIKCVYAEAARLPDDLTQILFVALLLSFDCHDQENSQVDGNVCNV